jgi:tetratricopeptide (TPR) repeat protein
VRWIAGAVITALFLAFAAVQAASDAFESRVAVAGTLPTRIPSRFGWAVYDALDRIAPAPYVEATLARGELARGDADAAERHALRLPASPVRDELLGRVAEVRGERTLALEYFLAAPDAVAVEVAAEAAARRDPEAAYSLEQLLEGRLAMLTTHPDAIAETFWRMGRFADSAAFAQVPGSRAQREWLKRALRDFDEAAVLAPLSELYLIEDANQADLLEKRDRAADLFRRAAALNPGSANAIAGLGVVAWQNGDRNAAELYLKRAHALDARSPMVQALERDLGSLGLPR